MAGSHYAAGVSSRWLSGRSLLLTAAVAIWVPGCAVAAWWQVTVALAGDRLGWLYSVEWPCFAVFGTVVWWNAVHDDPETVGARALGRARRLGRPAGGGKEVALSATGAAASPASSDPAHGNPAHGDPAHGDPVPGDPVPDDERLRLAERDDPQLAAYNRHLAELAASGAHRGWRHR